MFLKAYFTLFTVTIRVIRLNNFNSTSISYLSSMLSHATSTISPNFSKIVVRIELVCINFSAPFFLITLTFLFSLFFALPRNHYMACMNMDFWLYSCITYVITISTHMNFIWCLPYLSCCYSFPHILCNNYIYWFFFNTFPL